MAQAIVDAHAAVGAIRIALAVTAQGVGAHETGAAIGRGRAGQRGLQRASAAVMACENIANVTVAAFIADAGRLTHAFVASVGEVGAIGRDVAARRLRHRLAAGDVVGNRSGNRAHRERIVSDETELVGSPGTELEFAL